MFLLLMEFSIFFSYPTLEFLLVLFGLKVVLFLRFTKDGVLI